MGLERSLRPAEYLTRAVAKADAVVEGRLVSWHDTTAQRGPEPGDPKGTFQILRLRPERWLKGQATAGDLVAIDDRSWGEQEPPRPGIAGWDGTDVTWRAGDHVLAFLECDSLDLVAPPGTYLAAVRSVSRLSVDPGWSMYRMPGLQRWSPAREALVVREAAHQQPDSLLARAEAIFVARLNVRERFDSIRVETALRGTDDQARLPARLTWLLGPGVKRGGTALMLLRRTEDGVYEPVSLDAGVLRLDGDRVPAWHCTLADVRARIARIDARKQR